MAAADDQRELSLQEIDEIVDSCVKEDDKLQQSKEDIREAWKQADNANKLAPLRNTYTDERSFTYWLRTITGQVVYRALLQLCDCSYTESYDFFNNATRWG